MDNITIGIDLGDKKNVVYVLTSGDSKGVQFTVNNDSESMVAAFTKYRGATIALEAGTHSAWISRLLSTLGCHVLVGNPRKLRAIWQDYDKTDIRDAEMLARIARFDPHLLYPITHRGEKVQIDLQLLQSRDILVKNRSSLINHVRGSVKTLGYRLPSCSSACFHSKAGEELPEAISHVFQPILSLIELISNQIREYDRQIIQLSEECYRETELLRMVKGVGPVTSLAFVLILEDPTRFARSRQVGKFLGLVPRRDQSGETDKQLRITKAGNSFLRRLLVGAAQYILGPFGEDCNLRQFGLRLASRGGKNAKRRAVVAVARKLAVLLHRLWHNGEMYNPLHKANHQLLGKTA